MYLIITFLTMLVFTQAKTYHGYEQPDYTLARDQPQDKSFEIRNYTAATWVSVIAEGKLYESLEMFKDLFQYINGENQQNMTINMTVPVTIAYYSQTCIFCNHTYIMSFYLPKAIQSSPPKPIKSNVFIDNRSEMVAYVKTFMGLPSQCEYQHNVKSLHSDLQRNGITDKMVNPKTFIGAAYNLPLELFGRRNEVWILAEK